MTHRTNSFPKQNKAIVALTKQVPARVNKGGVHMIPGRLSFGSEFTPVPSCGSVLVYVIPLEKVVPERVIPARVHPGLCIGARISFRHEISQKYHVNEEQPLRRFGMKSVSR